VSVDVGPLSLTNANFELDNAGFTFNDNWNLLDLFSGSVSASIGLLNGEFVVSVDRSTELSVFGQTVNFSGSISPESFDLKGSAALNLGPFTLSSASFELNNDGFSFSDHWDLGSVFDGKVTAFIGNSGQGYVVSADADGTLLGNTVDLQGDISAAGFHLQGTADLGLFGVNLASVMVDLSSSQGFGIKGTWDYGSVFDGQVGGTIGTDGHVHLSGGANLHVGAFDPYMTTTIDLNPAHGVFSVQVGASLNVYVASVGFSADATSSTGWSAGSPLQLALSGDASIGGVLANVLQGSVHFTVGTTLIHFDGRLSIPNVPGASFPVDATVDGLGNLTGIPGLGSLGALAHDLQQLGGQAAAIWRRLGAGDSQLAQGLQSAIGLSGTGLVNALQTAVPDASALSNALQTGLGWTQQAVSSVFGSIGGSLGSSVPNTYTAAKKMFSSLGYTEGGVVFIDTNFNGDLDPGEPVGTTNAQGGFVLYIPISLDPNRTGVLADSKGQVVEQGGIDLVTGRPEVVAGVAPGSWSVISGLTTLVSGLYDNYGFTVGQGESQVLLATGLPAQLDLGTFDAIGATLAGKANGPAGFATESMLENTVAMVAALFGGSSGSGSTAGTVERAVAGLVAQATAPLDFGKPSTISALIQSVETSTGQNLAANLVAGAPAVVAGVNHEIEAIQQTTDLGYIRKVAQVSIVAQAQVAGDLAKAAAGTVPIDTIAANDTGAPLESAFAATATPPTLVVPMSVTAAATSPSGAQVSYTTQAYDIAGETLTPTNSIASGSSFPIGVTTVTTTATDSLGDTASATFTVTVKDSTPPTITLPANLTVEANTTGGANVTLPQATATDPVDPAPVVSEDHATGFFALGTTTVKVKATDAAGNVSTGAFTVTVVDTTPPTLSLPANLKVEANTKGGANVTLPQATATDTADPQPTVTEDKSSGFFPLGTTTIHVTASDASGNTSTGTFTVTVLDTTPPTLGVPPGLVVEANTTGGTSVTLPAVTATDVADPRPTVTEDHSSGFFPLGTTTVKVTATDASGNTSTGSFNVTVVDTTPPTLSLPKDQVVQANTTGGATVTLPAATATDVADPHPTVTADHAPGFFPLGTTPVHVTATDASGNVSTGTFTVTVINTTPPTLTLPKSLVVQANTAGGAFVTLPTATATDVADPIPLVSYDHSSGFFAMGTTTVAVTATDSSGNTSTGDFTVSVVNHTPPTLSLPVNVVVEANVKGGGAQVTLPVATATDVADPRPVIAYDPKSGLFPMGVTTVRVTATDDSGNVSSGSFTFFPPAAAAEDVSEAGEGAAQVPPGGVRVVDAGVGVPRRQSVIQDAAPPERLRPRVQGEGIAAEQDEGKQQEIAQVERRQHLLVGEPLEVVGGEGQEAQIAPGKPASRHDRSDPAHEPVPAAGDPGLDPDLAHRVGVPDRDGEVHHPDQREEGVPHVCPPSCAGGVPPAGTAA
jgi:hypothetical protein